MTIFGTRRLKIACGKTRMREQEFFAKTVPKNLQKFGTGVL
jgi:hypothetical protein